MFDNQQIMAVLLEAEDLRAVHRTWPMNMRLAVCLMPSGECQLLLFREEETGAFPNRLRKHLGLRPDEICLHPPVPGFSSRPLHYSDQRSLAALLADAPEILEDAQDYSVNYSYALEEGIDPVEFLGRDAADHVEPVDLPIFDAPALETKELSFSTRRSKPTAAPVRRSLQLDLHREAQKCVAQLAQEPIAVQKKSVTPQPTKTPGAGFKPAGDVGASQLAPQYTLTISPSGNYEIHGGHGARLTVSDVDDVFLRDDHKLLAIRYEGRGLPGLIRIHGEVLPSALQSVLAAKVGAVEISVSDGFAYVTLTDKIAEPVKEPEVMVDVSDTEEPVRRSSFLSGLKRSRSLRLLALTSITAAAIFAFLQFQSAPGSQSSENAPIDWSQFRLSQR